MNAYRASRIVPSDAMLAAAQVDAPMMEAKVLAARGTDFKLADWARSMRLAAATIIASLAWTACGMPGSAGTVQIELGKKFSLRTGGAAQTPDGAMRVGFEGITADSRCAKGEQCILAGEATVRVWLQRGAGQREARELHSAMGAAQAASAMGHEVHLVSLDPYPVTGKAIAKGDYVVTLTLRRGSTAESDR